MHAASHHAAGLFLARGHRRLAILRPDEPLAGDARCVAAFQQGTATAAVTEVRCHNSPQGVVKALRGLLRSASPPPGLYVLHSEHCVAALSFLLEQGVAVLGQMSIICREDEAYLGLSVPSAGVTAAMRRPLPRSGRSGGALRQGCNTEADGVSHHAAQRCRSNTGGLTCAKPELRNRI